MIRLNDIIQSLLSYHPEADVRLIEKAYVYSAKAHQGQVRLSGEPYLSHPLEVAYILTKMKMDEVCIASGLLHDTLEDTQATEEEIRRLFGDVVCNIVKGVTKISQIKFATREEKQAEYIRKMILAMANDIRVVLVKLADRLHNMRTLGYQPPEKQKLIAQETLDIYAPLAGRLGIYWLKAELEDLCFYYLEPEMYEKIKNAVAQRKEEEERFIREVKEIIEKRLAEAGIKATVKGRIKNLYSIYRKMVNKDIPVDQVYDLVGFRIIVNSIKECYETLGIIHSMWKQVPGRFKDYISLPKENMYQSLHTTVIGPYGQKIEIQIRTWEMDRIAEEGIAAHWKYKEGKSAKEADEKFFSWLRQIIETQQYCDPKEFLENVKMNLFPEEIYVFTPKGEVKCLPKGSTPVDFAYSIHSEIGDRCVGAKVDGRLVPLNYELKSGSVVEIITSPKQHPSKDWLEFVKTPKARTKIRQWLRKHEREKSISIGKEMLEKELAQEHINLNNKEEILLSVAKDMSLQSVDDLLAQIGIGVVSVRHIISRIKQKLHIKEVSPLRVVSRLVDRFRRKEKGIKIKGLDDIVTHLAKCCYPIPGDPVVGYITRGKGITIHRYNCRHIKNAEPERIINITWEPSESETYPARIFVLSVDKVGMLASISSAIAQKNANIISAEIKSTGDNKGIAFFTVEVRDVNHLNEVIGAIKKIKDIISARRI